MSGNPGWLGQGGLDHSCAQLFPLRSRGPSQPASAWGDPLVVCPPERCISESGRRILFIGLSVYPSVLVA